MKKLIYLLGIGALGYAAYVWATKKDDLMSTDNLITDPIVNPSLQTQPQQRFPYQNIIPPRVDNADQPWYSGTRAFMGEENSDVMGEENKMNNDVMMYDTTSFWRDLESKYTIH